MQKYDDVILAHLRENSRLSLTQLSKCTNIPISTLHERLKGFQKNIIKKNTALVDFTQLGYGARARVLFRVKKDVRDQLKDYLLHSPFLNELYKVNNGYDFMAEFIFKHMKDMEDYLDTLEQKYNVEKEVFYIVEELKREGFLSKPTLLFFGRK